MLKPHIKVCRYASGKIYWRVSKVPKVRNLNERIEMFKLWNDCHDIVARMNHKIQANNHANKFWQV